MNNKKAQRVRLPLKRLVVGASLVFHGNGAASIPAVSGKSTTTADHSKFKALQGPFERAEEVTAACLTCHTEAGEQIRQTTHWTWLYEHEETGQTLGKSKVINSFCGMTITNEIGRASCRERVK